MHSLSGNIKLVSIGGEEISLANRVPAGGLIATLLTMDQGSEEKDRTAQDLSFKHCGHRWYESSAKKRSYRMTIVVILYNNLGNI